jgi:hypothetical protein
MIKIASFCLTLIWTVFFPNANRVIRLWLKPSGQFKIIYTVFHETPKNASGIRYSRGNLMIAVFFLLNM